MADTPSPPSPSVNLVKNAVQVTNISPTATEQHVYDFFTFCGKIDNITFITSDKNQEAEAIVVFQSEAAAKTALLLTNALLMDRPIIVSSYSPSPPETSTNQESNSNPVPVTETPSVIASVIAGSYKFGSDAMLKAREFDETNRISHTVCQAAEAVADKVKELDNHLKISETVETITSDIREKAKEVDYRYGISDTASSVSNTLTERVNTLQKKALENPTISGVVNTLSQWGEDIGNFVAPHAAAVKAEVDGITQQSRSLIDQQQQQTRTSSTTTHDQQKNQQPKIIDL